MIARHKMIERVGWFWIDENGNIFKKGARYGKDNLQKANGSAVKLKG